MPDDVTIKDAFGANVVILADLLTHPTWGTGQAQAIKILSGADGDATPWVIDGTGAMPVSIAGTVNVKQLRPATPTRTNVAASATSVTLLAANTSRLDGTIYNDSSAILYIGLGAVAVSLTSFTVPVAAGGFYEIAYGYTGEIRGMWSSATGAARITEMV